eukprot:TRINITY_DN959_c0_g1_i1.p1 TRINITY_DN959_c0_g1~~TRINITY_DN959_c0_g1_i1.p1  ORF type:complete len:128 (-),score=42.56 TRINITY_DN959_c0_g1_i1:532-915(-)
MNWNTMMFGLIVLTGLASAGRVKRDTLTDIGDVFKDAGDSMKEAVGLDDKGVMDEIADFDKDKYCALDSNCVEPIQYCNKSTLKIYGTCDFVLWFWIACAGVIALMFCSCITSILCCCCSSLCRKAT